MFEYDELDEYTYQLIGEEKKLGYPPHPFIKRTLEKLYINIVGAIDLGDFETFLKEIADLTYDEAKEKMIREYVTQKQLSSASIRAKSKRDKAMLEQYAKQAEDEERTLERELEEIEEIARNRLAQNIELMRRNEELEREIQRLKSAIPPAVPTAPPTKPVVTPVPKPITKHVPSPPPSVHGLLYLQYKHRISQITTRSQADEVSNEIFDILEKQEFNKLTIDDITELREEVRKLYASIQIRPTIVPPTSPPPIHGSSYTYYKHRISRALNTFVLDTIYSEIYSILEKEEIGKLSDRDISELEEDIRIKREKIAKKVERIKAAPQKIIGLPPLRREPEYEYRPSEPLPEEIGDFLFSFNKIPGDDSDRFIAVINKRYKINWVRKEYIKKTAPNQVSVVAPQGTLSLTYHKDIGRVVMIYDTKSAEFLAIQQGSDINIYARKKVAVVRKEEVRRAEVTIRGYRYKTPERVTDIFMADTFTRDLELERVIRLNNLLWFSSKDLEKWFLLSPRGKFTLYHYDIGAAFRRVVETLQQYSWESLEKDYSIPKEYIDQWKSGKSGQ